MVTIMFVWCVAVVLFVLCGCDDTVTDVGEVCDVAIVSDYDVVCVCVHCVGIDMC